MPGRRDNSNARSSGVPGRRDNSNAGSSRMPETQTGANSGNNRKNLFDIIVWSETPWVCCEGAWWFSWFDHWLLDISAGKSNFCSKSIVFRRQLAKSSKEHHPPLTIYKIYKVQLSRLESPCCRAAVLIESKEQGVDRAWAPDDEWDLEKHANTWEKTSIVPNFAASYNCF